MRRRHFWLLALVLALVGAACGSGAAEPVGTRLPANFDSSTEQPSNSPPPAPAGVTLDLNDGSQFVLADAVRPVLFVFWAEW